MKKLWDKNSSINEFVEAFTAGNDPVLDLELAPWDIIGSIAHVAMLAETNLISVEEKDKLIKELKSLYRLAADGKLIIDPAVEDIHSQVENELTKMLGDTGKKIHTARSRNDQIILDIRLYAREKLTIIREEVLQLFNLLIQLSEKYHNILMPGYTHFQVAMPSSFGLWFSSFAESLADDMILLNSAYRVVNQNPLGTAAGYGSSLPVNREMTTHLLGFDDMVYNSIYAQVGRGKTEKMISVAMASVASTLSLLAMDAVLFMGQNFGFLSLPDAFTTGSSIMPHKKNPDAFELIRAYGNKIQALPNEIQMIGTNLPSGYHRDKQILKESLFPAFNSLQKCLRMTMLLLGNIKVNPNILDDERYRYIFSVEEVNELVKKGIPFREAYRRVAGDIEKGKYVPERKATYTHEGSIGNPGNPGIRRKMEQIAAEINPQIATEAMNRLLTA
ncbi:MAG: argininosuccinate lyase [Chlorobi bacterium]|nr:argininosuccinate lyase [Chlorobiota bacterium]